jgi:hypothetical protein
MIKNRTPGNFLRHIFSESVPDLANITVAESEDDYDVILGYLNTVKETIGEWINELKKEKEQ